MGLDTLKSIGPLEGMTLGAAWGGVIGTAIPVPIIGTVSGVVAGAVIGGIVGGINSLGQFFVPDLYDSMKASAYEFYDEKAEKVKELANDIGKGVNQGLKTVKNVYQDVQNTGKSIGKAISSVNFSKIKFGW